MLHRRKTYTIRPERLQEFTDFFHTYIYPIQASHGARLVGRWVTEDKSEVMALWEYRDREHYEQVERDYRGSTLRREAMKKRARLGKELYIKSSEEFMMPTGHYTPPRAIVAVSAYITNESGEVLLVKNMHRNDSFEMPGGQVEEHESLIDAIHREVMEETGVEIEVEGITGIYQNVSSRILGVTFRAKYVSGELRPQIGETQEVGFYNVDAQNVGDYIKREHFQMRFLDAVDPTYMPYAIYKVRPFELIERIERQSV
ncbi:NUDIX domain-containing protein [Exiguobacterium qingdaonense]|uniref:NUDIX domain-containing protein n=1 Tax=Exiguobacterium qingdaonense TaxID=2751251 RepID=UPI001BE76884|nr:NUDIX domain-containing protein [Exiguobacterium qingdaonense]